MEEKGTQLQTNFYIKELERKVQELTQQTIIQSAYIQQLEQDKVKTEEESA